MSTLAEGKRDVKNIFSTVAPYMDFLNVTFSFGLSNLWRRVTVSMSGIKEGDRVLDACTGTGELAFLVAKKVGPEGGVIGVDFCEDMLEIARKRANESLDPDLRRVSFLISDIRQLPFGDNSFDAVTVAFGIRNVPDQSRALGEILRILKPGGRFTCLELVWPEREWFLPLYNYYMFKIMPAIGRAVTRSDVPYSYLPKSIKAFYSVQELTSLIMKNGFSQVVVHPMTFGIATVFSGVSQR
jgi:demethylmenaquinone methyltransferase/2-methoxy-6-polyprenyl-1,4-benzoquinol methylase